MSLNLITIIGLIAGTLTTLSFLPQLLKIQHSRSAKDISLLMYVVISTGILLWLIYGLLVNSLPVILANAITLAIALAILVCKLKYR